MELDKRIDQIEANVQSLADAVNALTESKVLQEQHEELCSTVSCITKAPKMAIGEVDKLLEDHPEQKEFEGRQRKTEDTVQTTPREKFIEQENLAESMLIIGAIRNKIRSSIIYRIEHSIEEVSREIYNDIEQIKKNAKGN